MENPLKQRRPRPRISRRTALEPALADAASLWSVEHGVSRKVFLSVAIRRAMADPEALREMIAMEDARYSARRDVRLRRQAIYRHLDML